MSKLKVLLNHINARRSLIRSHLITDSVLNTFNICNDHEKQLGRGALFIQ